MKSYLCRRKEPKSFFNYIQINDYRHHPGDPYFHDAYKGWSCCQVFEDNSRPTNNHLFYSRRINPQTSPLS